MKKVPVPTGNPWKVTDNDPATVPVPLPVVIVGITGPYTERDRKLWAFLLAAVWDELGTKTIHELPVAKINQVFRETGGEHGSAWIWECAERLTRTIIEWRHTENDKRYKGISSLFGAVIDEDAQADGTLRFHFPPLLVPVLKDPRRFSRLRVHFLLKLSGKYAVTLYELLESVANKKDPALMATLDELRQWLKVPEGKLTRYVDLKRFAIEPALKQINKDPSGAGFRVDMKPIKKGRAVDRIRFTLHKTDDRVRMESDLKNSEMPLFADTLRLSTVAFEKAREVAPGWDVYALEQEWREWMSKKPKPDKPDQAFIGFCRKKHKKEGHP
ncbi:MAG: replication initiation protein [bacterium]|nr:replication initiation protein [bacterium]